MGRDAGWVALAASDAARHVNICLIPEFEFELYGEEGVYEYCYKRLLQKSETTKRGKSCVIVVAEGAVESVRDLHLTNDSKD
jgi:6-phosphofructokinase 1